MSFGFNKTMLLGRAGMDAETRMVTSTFKVARFTLATPWPKKTGEEWTEETDWHTIICKGSTADTAEKLVKKGMQIVVEGAVRYRKYEDKNKVMRDVTEIVAHRIYPFIEKKKDGTGTQAQAAQAAQPEPQAPEPDNDYAQTDFDDLPF